MRSSARFRHLSLLLSATLLAAAFSVLIPGSALAGGATFNVDTAADRVDTNPGDGQCVAQGTNPPKCSLRAAVMEANALGGGDVINLGSDTYLLTLVGATEDAAATGDLDVTQTLTIRGEDEAETIIDGRKLDLRASTNGGADDEAGDRIFDVHNATSLVLEDLTVQRGNAGPSSDNNTDASDNCTTAPTPGTIECEGGAIRIQDDGADLSLNAVTLKNNVAENEGGAVFVTGAGVDVNVTDSTVRGNRSENGGGGFYFEGDTVILVVSGSEIGGPRALAQNRWYGNRASADAADGGGIYFGGSDPTATFTDTQIRHNQAGGSGGAIYVADTASGADLTFDEGSVNSNEAQGNATTCCPFDDFGHGGGVYLDATAQPSLTAGGTTFQGNSANDSRGFGGAIYAGTLAPVNITLDQGATIARNHAREGGGVYFAAAGGTLNVTDVTFDRNRDEAGGGGGLNNNDGTANILRTTFSDNQANLQGGAIRNNSTLNVTNSTFSGNRATGSCCPNPGRGGGIYNTANGNVSLLNVTMTDHGGVDGSTGTPVQGSSIYNVAPDVNFDVENTIVANSKNGVNCEDEDSAEPVVNSLGGNIEDADTCGFDETSDQINTDVELEALANNGGLTETHALPSSDSPAVDTGQDANCPAEDQRGTTRPQDGDNDSTATCDVGAYEFVFGEDTPVPPPSGFDIYVDSTADGPPDGCDPKNDCTIRDAVEEANDTPGAQSIFIPTGNYKLTELGPYEDNNQTGDLDLLDDVSIVGDGLSNTILNARGLTVAADATDEDRAFHIPPEIGDAVELQFKDLTITGGNPQPEDESGNCETAGPVQESCHGGALLVEQGGSEIDLDHVKLYDNRAHYNGGGIYLGSNGTSLTIRNNSVIAGNLAESRNPSSDTQRGGGALFVNGNGANVTLRNSTFGGDTPSAEFGRRQPDSNDAEGGQGGAIYFKGNGAEVEVTNVDFMQNIAEENGPNNEGAGAMAVTGEGFVMNMTGGSFQDNDASNGAGGALYVDAGLEREITFDDVLFSRNQANNDGVGGAIFVDEDADTTMLIKKSRFFENKADASAGGIFWRDADGALTVNDTWFDEQIAGVEGGDFADGSDEVGGSAMVIADGTATLNRVAMTNGESELNGGAMVNLGTVTVTNSTFSGNFAYGDDTDADTNTTRDGGAIYNGSDGDLTLKHVTIASNTSDYENGPTARTYADADGIFDAGVVRMKSSIVADSSRNEDTNDEAENCSGSINSQGDNLDDQNDCDFNAGGDKINKNPRLGPLRRNGGPTPTHALLAGSPAIDAAPNAGCPGVDQRNKHRPEDGDKNGTANCDMGAYELQVQDPPDPTCPGYEKSNLNQVVGTPGNDTLNGTNQRDVICGKKGNDKINGKDGNDILLGGKGNDEIDGGADNDKIRGQGGGDTVNSGGGNDTVNLGNGNDEANLGGGRDKAQGHTGKDRIDGQGGDDPELRGEDGDDNVKGGDGDDFIRGNKADDKLNGEAGDDDINGGKGTDEINGGPDTDKCNGGGGAGDTKVNCEN